MEQHKTAAELRAELVEIRDRLKREIAAMGEPSAFNAAAGMNNQQLYAELRGDLAEVEAGLAKLGGEPTGACPADLAPTGEAQTRAADPGANVGRGATLGAGVVETLRANPGPFAAFAIIAIVAVALYIASHWR